MNPQNNPMQGSTPQMPPTGQPQVAPTPIPNPQAAPANMMPPQSLPTPPTPPAAQMQQPQPPMQPVTPTNFQPQLEQPAMFVGQQPVTMQQAAYIQPAPQITQATQPAAPAAPEPPKVIETPISTQATLQFSELRDSLVIMKDGSFRAVVACQSINFDLMSEQEREGVEYSYQNFLNSLNFTVQILVRSQRVDIGPYIEKLTKIRRDNDNMLLGVLMDDYINFIDILSQEANIMDKSFFVVIPYYGSADLERAVEQTKNLFKAFGKNKTPGVTRINRDVYNKAIDELNNRVESVISGLFQIGIQSVRLNTKELSQLFYNFNNPDTAVREPLVDFNKLATTYVKKGVK